MRTDRLRLLDAIEQIQLLSRFAERGRQAFFAEVCKAHPGIPWSQTVAFRNVVVHQYFGIDLELVWAIVTDLNPRQSAFIGGVSLSPDVDTLKKHADLGNPVKVCLSRKR
jgi:hypothetical protein